MALSDLKIFLSYSWNDKKLADKIFYDLSLAELTIVKDDHSIKYTDKISEFMKRIRESDFALILVSDSYLKSVNCMTEVMELSKDEGIWKKILPVVSTDTKFYDPIDRIRYIKYWENKSAKVEEALNEVQAINATSSLNELKKLQQITQNIDSFLVNLKDHLSVSDKDLVGEFYKPLTDKLGIEPEFEKYWHLINVSTIKDPAIRLKAISKFIKETPTEHSLSVSILASSYRDLKQYPKAIRAYKKSLDLDDTNFAAWNNLGRIYEHNVHNYPEAKKCYRMAIQVQPKEAIPRLNLGVLLSDEFNDVKGAVEQYHQILEFDENNVKAHSNLGNAYLTEELEDIELAEKHYKIAVKQGYVKAMILYAIFLKRVKGESEDGNNILRQAKILDVKNYYGEAIDNLIDQTSD